MCQNIHTHIYTEHIRTHAYTRTRAHTHTHTYTHTHAARHMAGNEGHTGPLLPRHIRRAFQQLELAEKGPPRKQPRKRMFKS